MKPTPEQQIALDGIAAGAPITMSQHQQQLAGVWSDLTVHTYQHSHEGSGVMLAHRTVLRDDVDAGTDPRMAFRTELFRIYRDGSVARL